MGNGARGDPTPGGVRAAAGGAPRPPSPSAAVAVRPRLAPDAVAVRGRPAPADGGQGLEAWCRWSACGVVTEGVDGGGEGLPTGLAGGPLQCGRWAVRSGLVTDGLPEEVTALSEGGHARLVRGASHAACGSQGVDRRQDGVCSHRPCVGGDAAVIGPSHVIALGHPAMPGPALSDAFAAVESPRTDDEREETAWWNACRGRQDRAVSATATAEPCGEDARGQGEGGCEPREGAVVDTACPSPCQEPGGSGVLPEDLHTVGEGLRAPARGSEPVGVRVRGGCGTRLERVARDGLPRPSAHGWHRPRAVCAGVRGPGEAVPRSGAIATPLASTGDGGGLVLWGMPAVVLPPGRLWAGGLRDARDGTSARSKRVPQPRVQALALAPRPCLPCLDDAPPPRCEGAIAVSSGPRTRGVPWTTRCPLRLGVSCASSAASGHPCGKSAALRRRATRAPLSTP
jgi:hypothetical protein